MGMATGERVIRFRVFGKVGLSCRERGRADSSWSADFGPEGDRGRAPPRIRQSRSCHRREQSFAHSGVRHALLPPEGDGSSAPCGAELFFLFSFASQNHSRRWRQVGGPRRVSPTVLKAAGPRRSPLLLSIRGTTTEELRPASGRAGAAIGASRASRTPECGTLCCRRRGMAALLHVGRSSFSSSFLTREELRVRTIHADGDKWADRGGSALPF